MDVLKVQRSGAQDLRHTVLCLEHIRSPTHLAHKATEHLAAHDACQLLAQKAKATHLQVFGGVGLCESCTCADSYFNPPPW